MNNYKVTVKKGNEVDSMITKAETKDQASLYVLETHYYDGWYLVSCEEV